MKTLFLALLLLTPAAEAAPELSCAEVREIADRCRELSRADGLSLDDLAKSLQAFMSCVERATGQSFTAANKKYSHCR